MNPLRHRPLVACAAAALLAACSPPAAGPKSAAPAAAPAADLKPVATPATAGDYSLDKAHSSLTFKVNHLGFSNYTARFQTLDAKLTLDPANPTAAKLDATVDPRSLLTPPPPKGFIDSLLGPQWLDAGKFAQITYRSTAIELTGPNTAKVTGDLTLHGVTKPVVLNATFNGGYAGHPMDPHARIGFSAQGAFKRSDFGIGYGLPPAGSTMGVGDRVDVAIDAEFSGPPLVAPPPPAAAK